MATSRSVESKEKADVLAAASAVDAAALTTAGQRKVNLTWEYTQALICISIVFTCMAIFIIQAMEPGEQDFPDTLSNMAFSVLAFYLARTNHQAIGGIGSKPLQPYEGR